MKDGNAGGPQFIRPHAFDPKRTDMRPKARAIQAERDLGQLPLAASVVKLTGHQQDARFRFGSRQVGFRITAEGNLKRTLMDAFMLPPLKQRCLRNPR